MVPKADRPHRVGTRTTATPGDVDSSPFEFSNYEFQRVRMRGTEMHSSRLCAVLIDCKPSDVDEAARFWGEALGRTVDKDHPGSRGNYRMLETPPDEPIVEVQHVDHESRVHLDI